MALLELYFTCISNNGSKFPTNLKHQNPEQTNIYRMNVIKGDVVQQETKCERAKKKRKMLTKCKLFSYVHLNFNGPQM